MRYFLNASKRASDLLIKLKLISGKLNCWDCKNPIIPKNGYYIKPYTGINYYLNKIFDFKERYICSGCHKVIDRNNKLKKLI